MLIPSSNPALFSSHPFVFVSRCVSFAIQFALRLSFLLSRRACHSFRRSSRLGNNYLQSQNVADSEKCNSDRHLLRSEILFSLPNLSVLVGETAALSGQVFPWACLSTHLEQNIVFENEEETDLDAKLERNCVEISGQAMSGTDLELLMLFVFQANSQEARAASGAIELCLRLLEVSKNSFWN